MKTVKIVALTAVITTVVVVAPIVAFVQGVNYEKRNSAEIQAKATALIKSVAPAPVAEATASPKK